MKSNKIMKIKYLQPFISTVLESTNTSPSKPLYLEVVVNKCLKISM